MMLSLFKPNRPASESEDSSSSDEERVLAPGTPYLTKVNGKLVWARQKTPKSSVVHDLVGEAFGTRTLTIRKRSKSLERPAPKQLMGSVPVVRSEQLLAHSTPIPQQPFPGMMLPMSQYPPQFGPPPLQQCLPLPLPRAQLYIPQQPSPPPPLFVQPSPTERDYEVLKAADAHFNKMYKSQPTRITSASSEGSQEKVRNKSQERPDIEIRGKTDEKAILNATIAVTKHVCGECGRLRSRRFHHDNPIKPGEIPIPAFCRKCQRDASSTSDSSTIGEREKKDKKKTTNTKRMIKKGARSKKKKQLDISSDDDESSENLQPDPAQKPVRSQPEKPTAKRVHSTGNTIIEEKFSEYEREPRGRLRSRSPDVQEFHRRPLSPSISQYSRPRSRSVANVRHVRQDLPQTSRDPVKDREIFQETARTRNPSVRYRHVEVVPSHGSFEANQNPFPRNRPIHSVEKVVYERAASPPSHYREPERLRGKSPSSKACSVEEPESMRRGPPRSQYSFGAPKTSNRDLPSESQSLEMHDVAARDRPTSHHNFEAREASIRVAHPRDHSFEARHQIYQDHHGSQCALERGEPARGPRSRDDSLDSQDLSSTSPVFEEQESSARGRPSRENSLEERQTVISNRSAEARQRRRLERAPRPESPGSCEEPHSAKSRSQPKVEIVKQTSEYRTKKKVDEEEERRRQEYIDRATLRQRKGNQFSTEEAVQYYHEDWSRAERDSIFVPSIVAKSYQSYRPDSVASQTLERNPATVPLIGKKPYHGYRRERHPDSDLSESEASYPLAHHNLPRVPSPPLPVSHSKVDEWQDQPPYPPSSGSEAARRRLNAHDRKILHMPHVQIPSNHHRNSSRTRLAYVRDESDDLALAVSPKHSIEQEYDRYDDYVDSNFTEIRGPTRYSEVSVSNLTELERQAEAEARHVTFRDTPSVRSLHDPWDLSGLHSQRYGSEHEGAEYSGDDGGWYVVKASSVGGGTGGGRVGGWDKTAGGGGGEW